eukprot:COSAG02_NODE_2604_length_8443_cov_6.439593_9_plen_202_part_00
MAASSSATQRYGPLPNDESVEVMMDGMMSAPPPDQGTKLEQSTCTAAQDSPGGSLRLRAAHEQHGQKMWQSTDEADELIHRSISGPGPDQISESEAQALRSAFSQCDLDAETLARIAQMARRETYDLEEVVFDEGDPSDFTMCVIVSGTFGWSTAASPTEQHRNGTFTHGESFGCVVPMRSSLCLPYAAKTNMTLSNTRVA